MSLDKREFMAPQLGPGLPPLPNDVTDEERQRASERVGTGEIRHVRTREDPLLVTDGTVRAKTVGCVSGKDVPATGAAIREQSPARRQPVLDLAGCRQLTGDHELAGRFVVPAKRRNVSVVTEENPGLGGRGLR